MTTAIVPSFVAKLNRAEKHLIDLQAALEQYGGTDARTRPYTVRKRIEGKAKREVHRLHFTRGVGNTDIPLIAADAIYNLRSSLEHLMASIVASKDRDSVTFPVFWRSVWEAAIPGENAQRGKDRQRWSTIAKALPVEAVTFLKRLQPPDEAGNKQTPHGLRLLNQFSNADRHTKLPLFAHGVEGLLIRWRLADGEIVSALASADPGHFVEDDAEIREVPSEAVYMECYGPPVVVVRTALKDADGKVVNVPIVDFIRDQRIFIRDKVVPKLLPYVHTPGRRCP
jgi:hypothetical protein